jgi:hypothetical protein
VKDVHRFWLIAEWSDIEEHARIRKKVVDMRPTFVALVEGGTFIPDYARVVSSTPQDVLDKASRQSG